jgi:pimeloyl-ACP methyl ester carboxylesterase
VSSWSDDDVVTLDHAITMFDALDHGQLTIVPGTSHLLYHERPELLTALIQAFVADPTPHTLMLGFPS